MVVEALNGTIQQYPSSPSPYLLDRLALLEAELVPLLRDYGNMQADECRSKADAWLHSPEQSVTGRSKDADLAAYHVTASILELRGQIEAIKEERSFIILLLGRRNEESR